MCDDNGPQGVTLHSLGSRKIIRYNHLVVKSGRLYGHEAETLRFIAAKTSIPVPKVHDVKFENGQVVAIVMDYMPGNRLDEAWKALDASQKTSIANELHGYLNQLRKLKGDYIGSINRGKAIVNGRIDSMKGGPFDCEQHFNDFILGDIVESAPDLLRHYAKFALIDDHEIVFTHSDLSPRNILVENGHVIAILDWEFAGWYPEHWEYIQARRYLMSMPDWHEYLLKILPPRNEREYIGMSFLLRIMSH